jgi:transposase-like protein
VTLQIRKLRPGSFFPSLLEPRRRIDKAPWAVVMEAYVQGVPTISFTPIGTSGGIASQRRDHLGG